MCNCTSTYTSTHRRKISKIKCMRRVWEFVLISSFQHTLPNSLGSRVVLHMHATSTDSTTITTHIWPFTQDLSSYFFLSVKVGTLTLGLDWNNFSWLFFRVENLNHENVLVLFLACLVHLFVTINLQFHRDVFWKENAHNIGNKHIKVSTLTLKSYLIE